MKNPEDSSLVEAPKNRAQAWFRVVLWILPLGFLVVSTEMVARFEDEFYRYDLTAPWVIWWILNAVIIVGSGWFNALLSIGNSTPTEGMLFRTALFCGAQLFIIIPLGFVGLMLFIFVSNALKS